MTEDTNDTIQQLVELVKVQMEQHQQTTAEMRQLVQMSVESSTRSTEAMSKSTETMNRLLEVVAKQLEVQGVAVPAQLGTGQQKGNWWTRARESVHQDLERNFNKKK